MTLAPDTAPTQHVFETTVATSNRQGTVLPRSGVFWGVHPPRYHSAIVIGELTSSREETPVRYWFEPHEHLYEQTSLTCTQTDRVRLMNFVIDINKISSSLTDVTSRQFATGSFAQATTVDVVRDFDIARAFVPKWNDLTDSPWRTLRSALAPLLTAPEAILEAIRAELEKNRAIRRELQHPGLAAVDWLRRTLDLSRPTILRMGRVPESTFYAWQKNPNAVVRTPSVNRIWRLQAQIALLEKVLGRDDLKAWLMSRDHLERLQGDDATFMEALAEAEETVTKSTPITPRRRMRVDDYKLDAEQAAEVPSEELPNWPGASKIPEERAE
jgi:hypothetical protein